MFLGESDDATVDRRDISADFLIESSDFLVTCDDRRDEFSDASWDTLEPLVVFRRGDKEASGVGVLLFTEFLVEFKVSPIMHMLLI